MLRPMTIGGREVNPGDEVDAEELIKLGVKANKVRSLEALRRIVAVR